MTLDPVADVVFDCQKVDSVNGYYSSHGVVNSITSGVALGDVTIHMEMDAISAYDTGLTAISELTVSYVSQKTILCATCHH